MLDAAGLPGLEGILLRTRLPDVEQGQGFGVRSFATLQHQDPGQCQAGAHFAVEYPSLLGHREAPLRGRLRLHEIASRPSQLVAVARPRRRSAVASSTRPGSCYPSLAIRPYGKLHSINQLTSPTPGDARICGAARDSTGDAWR